MAGHSKWKQIKRKKAINDQKRGANFTKLIREITVAARSGGGDPDLNPRLRLAVDTARAANMPNDNIERAIRKGTGDLEGVAYEEIAYEGYGPGGVAIYVETMTDNPNRTVAEVRFAIGKHGGSMGTSGSVAWQFERKGQLWVDAKRYDEDSVLMAALEAGALDAVKEDDSYLVSTDVSSFHAVQQGLKKAGIEIDEAELAFVPNATVSVSGEDAARLLKLLDALDDLDDVQKVHTNADIDEKALEEVNA